MYRNELFYDLAILKYGSLKILKINNICKEVQFLICFKGIPVPEQNTFAFDWNTKYRRMPNMHKFRCMMITIQWCDKLLYSISEKIFLIRSSFTTLTRFSALCIQPNRFSMQIPTRRHTHWIPPIKLLLIFKR